MGIETRVPTEVAGRDLRAVRRLHAALKEAMGVELPVRLWDGTELGPPEPPFRLVLTRPSAFRSLLVPPRDVSAGEAYILEDIDVEGDMIAALETAAALSLADIDLPWGIRLRSLRDAIRLPHTRSRRGTGAAKLRGRGHSLSRDRRAVRFHYDVGNHFYQLFLDSERQYSSAYFAHPDEPLDVAQRRKLELICRKLRLRPGERFLDVGCGWGSLVLHAAREHGVHGVGITLSEQQHELARERAADEGLTDRVEFRIADYREVEGDFDAVASIGMYEHVGPDHLDGYFTAMHRLVTGGGRLLNSGITTGRRLNVADMTRQDTFAGRYVFPDGGLVPAWRVVRHLERAGFELFVEQLRRHYALTLRHWVRRLEANRVEATRLVGDRLWRTWRAYMAGSVVGFESGDLGLVQVLGMKDASVPLRRNWMLPDG